MVPSSLICTILTRGLLYSLPCAKRCTLDNTGQIAKNVFVVYSVGDAVILGYMGFEPQLSLDDFPYKRALLR